MALRTHARTHARTHTHTAHLQMMLWKAADQQGPPKVDITQFGWVVKGGIPSPCIDTGLPAPQGLIDVINCGCQSEQRTCCTESYNCHKNNVKHCLLYRLSSQWVLQPIHNEGRCTQESWRTSRVRVSVADYLETVVFRVLPTQEMDIDSKTYNGMHRMYCYFTGFHYSRMSMFFW